VKVEKCLGTSIARQRIDKDVPKATNTHREKKELLEAVFSLFLRPEIIHKNKRNVPKWG
jgi:hypothetical protein